jgi:predicted MFS family arabinose efflux permease
MSLSSRRSRQRSGTGLSPWIFTLGSISINLARAVGPAIAGLLIARAGVGAVFALNTATLLLYGLVVAAWRPRPGRSPVA